jgi:hypothetical protein
MRAVLEYDSGRIKVTTVAIIEVIKNTVMMIALRIQKMQLSVGCCGRDFCVVHIKKAGSLTFIGRGSLGECLNLSVRF